MKPKLLVVQLWGLGDLAITTPFLSVASKRYNITLIAKPHAMAMQKKFWPDLNIVLFNAPWTKFYGKYNILRWQWWEIGHLISNLRKQKFDYAISGRLDPRDHFLIWLIGAKKRIGFPHLGSSLFLTTNLHQKHTLQHCYDNWLQLGEAVDVSLPLMQELTFLSHANKKQVLIHTGAAQPTRVYPLEHYQKIACRLSEKNIPVQIVCDPNQIEFWQNYPLWRVIVPTDLDSFLELLSNSCLFIGNDSGPGHLAAISGIPTFTIFGPQHHYWFRPIHPFSDYVVGRDCPYKPCSDYCRFDKPKCIQEIDLEYVWHRIEQYVKKCYPNTNGSTEIWATEK